MGGSGGIRSEKADLAPAPWWTSFAQSPLELTPEEIAAADLLAGRTPPPPAPEPAPVPAPVSARSRLRARLAASLSVPASAASQTSAPRAAAPASDTHSQTRLAETAAQASAAARAAAASTGAAVAFPVAATSLQPAAAAAADPRSAEPLPAPTVASAHAGARAAAGTPLVSSGDTGTNDAGAATAPSIPLASSGTTGNTGTTGTAAPRSAFGANASSGMNAPVAASGPRASAAASSGSGPARPASAGRPPGGTRPGKPRLLIWIAGGLVLVLALTALFFLGQSLVGGDATPVAVATSSATPSATPSAAPSAPAEAAGPQPVGVHLWNTLFGGECLQPYVSPWAEEFTVADCATPHTAQLVHRGLFEGDAGTAFPGEAELAGQINLLCSAPGVIDLAAASAYDDVQVQGGYPITEEQWSEGARYYYCFVSRASGEPLTASVAGPGPAA